MTSFRIRWLLLAGILLAVGAIPASAQPVGTFRWQIQPYCNILVIQVVQQGGLYVLNGTDDQCGAAQQASIVGLAFQNPSGSIGFGLTIVTAPGATPIHIDATISVATLGGTWRDSAGNNGTFIFTPGAGTGGPPRPVLPGGLPPGSITAIQIAAGAVGSPQLAANSVSGTNIINGSITGADILDGPRAAFAQGDQFVALTNVAAVVRSVAITAPTAGRVLVNTSGYFRFADPAVIDTGRCSITLGTTLEAPALILTQEAAVLSINFVAFGGTRGFNVAAGTVTINLVCDEFSGNVFVEDTALTATFVAQ